MHAFQLLSILGICLDFIDMAVMNVPAPATSFHWLLKEDKQTANARLPQTLQTYRWQLVLESH